MAPAGYVGEIGQRLKLALTPISSQYFESEYGDGVCTLILYEDDEGRIVRWFASSQRDVVLGERQEYLATIKAHREGETHVIRVTPYVPPEEQRVKSQTRRAAKQEYLLLKARADEAWDACRDVSDPESPLWPAYRRARDAADTAFHAWKEM